jgi:predicted metalloprotease
LNVSVCPAPLFLAREDGLGRPSTPACALNGLNGLIAPEADAVTFRPGARLDASQVRSVGGRAIGGIGARSLAVGGGGIGSIVLLVVLVLASGYLNGGGGGGGLGSLVGRPLGDTAGGTDLAAECKTGADANAREDCRVVGFVDSIQAYWRDAFSRAGSQYRPAITILYEGATDTGCGMADSAVGPFYCPVDRHVYLDVSFFDEMHARFGAQGGPLAEGYVIAHEYGHHVQGLLGALRSDRGDSGPGSVSVQTELQADCYAGVWAANAVDTGYLEPLTQSEVAQALDAAAAVGDDRIQRETTGSINPEAWTHGSAQERQAAFASGYRGADPDSCPRG